MAGIDKLYKAPVPVDHNLGKVTVLISGKPRKKTKPPTNMAVAADTLYRLRAERLAVQQVVEQLAAEESIQREYIIENLPKSKASGITGRLATARIETKEKPRVVDWQKLYAYVKRNNRFDLLQKRVSETAVAEMWQDKKVVPGTEKFTVITVSCTKK